MMRNEGKLMQSYDSINPLTGNLRRESSTSFASDANTEAPRDSGKKSIKYRTFLGIRRSTWLLFGYTLAYGVYLVLGALALANIETQNELQRKRDANQVKQEFLRKYPSVNRSDLEELLAKAMSENGVGISMLDDDVDSPNWTIGQGFLFTVSVVTTVGYGHLRPLTSEGKVFVLIYAILGIPFTLVFVSASVQRFLEPAFQLLFFFFACLGKRVSSFTIRLVHLAFMLVVFVVCYMLLPSLIFYCLEQGWSLLDAFYFVFITLTTIGLGDFVPAQQADFDPIYAEIYKIVSGVYILMGLVFMTLTATVFYDIPQLNIGTVLETDKDIHIGGQNNNEQSMLRKSFRKIMPAKNEASGSNQP